MTKTMMKAFKIIFQLLRRCLLGLFIAYWVVFVFYTAEKFVTGGSVRSSGGTSILTHRLFIEAMGGFLRNRVGENSWLASLQPSPSLWRCISPDGSRSGCHEIRATPRVLIKRRYRTSTRFTTPRSDARELRAVQRLESP
jgi:hypothetical protein